MDLDGTQADNMLRSARVSAGPAFPPLQTDISKLRTVDSNRQMALC